MHRLMIMIFMLLKKEMSFKKIKFIEIIMKKIVSIVSMLCIVMGISAQTVTGTAVLKMYSANSGDKSLTLIQADEFSDAYDASYDAEAQTAGGLYVISAGKHYIIWASNALSANLPLGFGTCDDLNYTLKFDNANFSGTPFSIYDAVADQTILVNGSNTNYDFTITEAQKNAAIEDRFIINYAPLAPEFCFRYNVLTVNGHDGESLIIKQGDAEIANVPALGNAYSKDLSGYNGRLVVTLNGQDYQIDANPDLD